jgi:S-formylglutathione hydrolase FrmB
MFGSVSFALVRRLMRIVAILFAALVVAGGSSRAAMTPARALDESFVSPALNGRLHFEVFLPEGYGTTRRRYPVLYVLHGLPAGSDSYHNAAFVAAAVRRIHGNAIVVTPQGARDSDSDPEYHDWGDGRDWATALTSELPAVIDTRFRTIRSRAGRALIGFSAGGYGASVIGLHHLDEFAVVESWSGYFHPTDPSGHYALSVGSAHANAYASVHTLVPKLRRAFRLHPTYFAFYVGNKDFFAAENVELNRELTKAGVWHTFRVYNGGHQLSLWESEAPRWLDYALAHLARS